jgi:sterol 3beta-glucosyltransferase
MARLVIMALGSRGDVQPAVALGVGLAQAGYTVRIASYAQFEPLARQYGLGFHPIEGDITAILQSDGGREMLNSRNPLKLVRVIRQSLRETYDQAISDLLEACEGTDLIVSLGAVYYAAASIAEAHNVPLYHAALQPLLHTTTVPNALLPLPPIDVGWSNRLSHRISDQMFWRMLRPIINDARRQCLDLPPWPKHSPITTAVSQGLTSLFAYSPTVIPKPRDWSENVHVTGYWFLPQIIDWQPPNVLIDFLADGSPPVYIGFGSMNNRDPKGTAELVVKALAQTGERGVLMRGWGGLQADNLPDNILMIDETPHDWLFPRMRTVVHHGGAGTTAAGLRAGVPAIITPFFADQPFWARYVHRLGVSPAPIPRQQLTVDKLAQAIEQAVINDTMRQKAAEIGNKICVETGVRNAVAIIDQNLRKQQKE